MKKNVFLWLLAILLLIPARARATCQIPIDASGALLIIDINACLVAAGGGSTAGGTNGQIQYNNAGNLAGLTVGNTLAAHNFANSISSTLVLSGTQPVCADLSDSAPSCYIDTTNASNITSGTLPGGQMPNLTGDTTSSGAATTTVGMHFGSNAVTLASSAPVSGGVPYFSSTSVITPSALLTANLPVLGGGAGLPPFSGTVSGNTTELATVSGAVTSTHCAKYDASGNLVDAGAACGTSSPAGSSGQIQWNSSGSFAGAAVASHSLVLAEGSGPSGLLLGADTIAQGVASSDPVALSLPNCPDTTGNHWNYSTSTHAITCGTSGGTPSAGGSTTQVRYNSSGALAGSSAFTLSGGAVSIGVSGTLGQLLLLGNTSGTVTIQPQAIAGTYNFNLPTTAGTSGYFLTSAGGSSSPMTWTAPSSGGNTPLCTTVTGTTASTLTPANTTYPVTECHNLVLSANNTTTTFASGGAPVNGWVDHLIVTQPSGGHSYSFTITAGSGVAIVYPTAGGCAALPSMPTGTGHALELVLLYNTNPSTPELDVNSCVATGS